ncbi:hypothetical protein B0J17DRAFT_764746 [Rhizoctonia solani]|nr:hypothetical protein B0J17DRAFT_764746 [Rhizoctonia solani]
MSANVYSTIMDTDRTVRDESMLDSGGESDVMDNIVFNRPMTRRMSKGKGAVLPPVASSSTTPTRRRSLRKSTSNATTPTRPRSSRRSSNTTSSPSSSVSQSQSQSQSSQSEPHAATDEPTGMSQELARVCVASQGKPNMEDAKPRTEGSVSPSESAHVPQPAAMEFDAAPFHVETDMGEQEGLEAGPRGARGATSASVFVFDTDMERASQPSLLGSLNLDKTRERTTSSSSLSSIPSPLPPPTKPEPKLRSLSPDSEAVLTSLHQSLLPSTRPQLKPIAKSSDRPAALPSAMKRRNEDLEPSSPSKRARFDPDPPPIPPPLRSRSPESPRPTQSSQPTQSSHPSQSSQSSQTSQPSRSLPGRIRVHPPNSSFTKSTIGNSFLGSHPPIVVRGQSSPSRQQLLLQRPAGPPMRVPVGQQQQQQQRALFSSRVVSPIRTGSTNGLSTGSPSKLQHNDARNGAWGAHVTSKKTQIKPPEVLIAPASDRSSSPARAARPLSRLPLPAGRKAKEKTQPEVDGVGEGESPPAGSSATGSLAPAAAGGLDSASSTSATLDVPSALPRERTPPTPLETPASPGSSTSTLIMDVPLFYQPPAPRHPPIPSKTPEEIIAEGTAREAQRKREQGKTKAAAAGAAAMRCLPLTRAPKRIIPDGSALQAWASVSHATGPLTETQKELQKLTAENTERNNAYGCVIERTDTFVDLPRPPSPTSRVRTKAQKSRELERQSRNERAQRRSAARGEEADTSLGSTNAEERRLAPGDDGEWIEPVRKGRHVRWAQSLVHDDVDKGLRAPEPSAAAPVGRGCLARTYNLDRHGNMYGPAPTTDPLRVVIVRYVYSDEPAFKVWKRGQS